VVATDPGSVKDLEAFSKQTGHPLLEHSVAGKEYTFYLRRK
jgi:tRNA 2-thiouridine synthesizing protein A